MGGQAGVGAAGGGDALRVVTVRVAGQRTETETARFSARVQAPAGRAGSCGRMTVTLVTGVHVACVCIGNRINQTIKYYTRDSGLLLSLAEAFIFSTAAAASYFFITCSV